jgi:hypothetical protein
VLPHIKFRTPIFSRNLTADGYFNLYFTLRRRINALARDLPGFPNSGIMAELTKLKPGHHVSQPGILFQKIPPERIIELKMKFGDENAETDVGRGKELHIR